MAEIWHYLLDDEPEGPVSREQLQELATAGVITPEDLVWRKGTDDWVPAKKVRGLFQPSGRPNSRSSVPEEDTTRSRSTDRKSSVHDSSRAQPTKTAGDNEIEVPAPDRRTGLPLPILLIGLHAGVTAAVTLLQSSQTSSAADLGSQLGSVTGMLGGLFGNALNEAGLPTTASPSSLPTTISSGVGWFASLLSALTVPLIVFEAAVCYGLFTHQWWARRIALLTYVAPILMAVVSLVSPVSLGSPLKLTIDALIAAGIIFFLTRPWVRDYFGDEEISWRLWLQPFRRSHEESE